MVLAAFRFPDNAVTPRNNSANSQITNIAVLDFASKGLVPGSFRAQMAKHLPERLPPKSKPLRRTDIVRGNDGQICDGRPPRQKVDESDEFFAIIVQISGQGQRQRESCGILLARTGFGIPAAKKAAWANENGRGTLGEKVEDCSYLLDGSLPRLVLESQTDFPPTKVCNTFTSRIFAGSMERISLLSSIMSASLPGVIEPLSF